MYFQQLAPEHLEIRHHRSNVFVGGGVMPILSSPLPLSHTKLLQNESQSWRQLQTALFLSFICAFAVVFQVVHEGRLECQSPLEYMLKMENKMHCDIFAKRPFCGFGKSQLNRHSLSHS